MFKVKVTKEDLTKGEQYLIDRAAKHFQECFNSVEFRQFVLNFKFESTYKTGFWPFRRCVEFKDNRFHYTDISNRAVYKILMSGKEILDGKIDQTANIYLKIDRGFTRNVVGYTYANTKWQWLYKWVLDSWDYKDIAGNLAHEWSHKAGFDHEYNYTYLREYSVPYAVGTFVSDWKK